MKGNTSQAAGEKPVKLCNAVVPEVLWEYRDSAGR
jgi:hypothetical protein